MPKLTYTQNLILERLFDMGGGYVLDFSNRTFSNFIQDSVCIDVYSRYDGLSKARMLRALILECDDHTVGKLILELLNYMKSMELVTEEKKKLFEEAKEIGNNLIGFKEVVTKNYFGEEKDQDIFVTYSWDSEEHKSNVFAFVAFLREKGFNATFDEAIMQEGTSVNFGSMMASNLYKSDKILVVLSQGYAEKANQENGGVGIEYGYIINEIRNNPNKYILVSFEELDENIINKITPFGLKGREVVDLKVDERNDYQKLFSKLSDKKTIKLPPVSDVKVVIKEKEIPKFRLNKNKQLSEILDSDEGAFEHPAEFFSDRLSQSFPGVRGIKWFTEPNEIIKRLAVLLKEPLSLKGSKSPIWWFRGSLSLQIEKCYFESKEKFLMNNQECLVDKVCVYKSSKYDRSFVCYGQVFL